MEGENSIKRSVHHLPNLPEEIITEILLRLPVKSLLKFRCVSNSWFSQISSPFFKNAHLNISTQNNNVYSDDRLVCRVGRRPTSLYTCSVYPKLDENSCVDIVPFNYPSSGESGEMLQMIGSCNGLVCLALYQTIILWNPATRESRELPHSGTNHSIAVYGFGYDATNDDYKVVEFSSRVCHETWVYDVQFRVFSVKADSWKTLDWDEDEGLIHIGPGIFVNGSLHWKLFTNYSRNRSWDVCALNLTTETCTTIKHPGYDERKRVVGCLGVSRGDLLLCDKYDSYTDIWVMKEYGVPGSWTKLFCVPYYQGLSWYTLRPLLLLKSGGILLTHSSGLVVFEPLNDYYKIDRFCDRNCMIADIYRESLISPNSYHVT